MITFTEVPEFLLVAQKALKWTAYLSKIFCIRELSGFCFQLPWYWSLNPVQMEMANWREDFLNCICKNNISWKTLDLHCNIYYILNLYVIDNDQCFLLHNSYGFLKVTYHFFLCTFLVVMCHGRVLAVKCKVVFYQVGYMSVHTQPTPVMVSCFLKIKVFCHAERLGFNI